MIVALLLLLLLFCAPPTHAVRCPPIRPFAALHAQALALRSPGTALESSDEDTTFFLTGVWCGGGRAGGGAATAALCRAGGGGGHLSMRMRVHAVALRCLARPSPDPFPSLRSILHLRQMTTFRTRGSGRWMRWRSPPRCCS